MARKSTPDKINADGSKTMTVKRSCNGCGQSVGDATNAELEAAVSGFPLPDVREECGCLAPEIGMTCTFGSGKTRWEIVKVNRNQDGAVRDLHLSKYLGDGYTNRWAKPDEVRNLKAQTLRVSLATILALREDAENAAKGLQHAIRTKTSPAKLTELVTKASSTMTNYANVYAIHLEDVANEAAEAQA